MKTRPIFGLLVASLALVLPAELAFAATWKRHESASRSSTILHQLARPFSKKFWTLDPTFKGAQQLIDRNEAIQAIEHGLRTDHEETFIRRGTNIVLGSGLGLLVAGTAFLFQRGSLDLDSATFIGGGIQTLASGQKLRLEHRKHILKQVVQKAIDRIDQLDVPLEDKTKLQEIASDLNVTSRARYLDPGL